MKKIILEYIALFIYERHSYYNDRPSIFFPDIPGCVTFAESTDEGFLMAKEALGLWLHGWKQSELPCARQSSELCQTIPFHVESNFETNNTNTSTLLRLEYFAIVIDYKKRKDIIIPDFPDFDLELCTVNISDNDLSEWIGTCLKKRSNDLLKNLPKPRKKDQLIKFHPIKITAWVDENNVIQTSDIEKC